MDLTKLEICKVEVSLNRRIYVLRRFRLAAKSKVVTIADTGLAADRFYTTERDVIKSIEFKSKVVKRKLKKKYETFNEILLANVNKKLLVTMKHSFAKSRDFVETTYEGIVVSVSPPISILSTTGERYCVMMDEKTKKLFVFNVENVEKISCLSGELIVQSEGDWSGEVHEDKEDSCEEEKLPRNVEVKRNMKYNRMVKKKKSKSNSKKKYSKRKYRDNDLLGVLDEIERDPQTEEKYVVLGYETSKDTFCYVYEILYGQWDLSWFPSYRLVVDSDAKTANFKFRILLEKRAGDKLKAIGELVCNNRTDFKVVKQEKRMMFKKKKVKDVKTLVAIDSSVKNTLCSYSLGKVDLELNSKVAYTMFDIPLPYSEVCKCVLTNSYGTNPLPVDQIIRIKNTTKVKWVEGRIEIFNPEQNNKETKSLRSVVEPGEDADIVIDRVQAVKVFYSPTTKKTDEMKKRGKKYFAKSIMKGRVQIFNLRGKPLTLFLSTSVVGKFIGSKEKCEVKETVNEAGSSANAVKSNLHWNFVIKEGDNKKFTFSVAKWEPFDKLGGGSASHAYASFLKKGNVKKPLMQQAEFAKLKELMRLKLEMEKQKQSVQQQQMQQQTQILPLEDIFGGLSNIVQQQAVPNIEFAQQIMQVANNVQQRQELNFVPQQMQQMNSFFPNSINKIKSKPKLRKKKFPIQSFQKQRLKSIPVKKEININQNMDPFPSDEDDDDDEPKG